MSKQSSSSRVPWTCPDCGRDYQVPRRRKPPAACKQCTRRNQKAAAGVPPVFEPVAVKQNLDETSIEDVTAVSPRQPRELPAEVEAHLAKQERERLLSDVANISRTMTFFRRLVWGMVFMMALNFVLIGAAFFYSMKQMSSLGGLLDQGEAAVAPQQPGQAQPLGQQQLPPDLAEKLKPIQDYLGTIDELLKDGK